MHYTLREKTLPQNSLAHIAGNVAAYLKDNGYDVPELAGYFSWYVDRLYTVKEGNDVMAEVLYKVLNGRTLLTRY